MITLGGESLVLTSGLIAALAGRQLKLFGSAPISLLQGSAVTGASETSDGRGALRGMLLGIATSLLSAPLTGQAPQVPERA